MPERKKPQERRFIEVKDKRTGHKYMVREDAVNPKKHERFDGSQFRASKPAAASTGDGQKESGASKPADMKEKS